MKQFEFKNKGLWKGLSAAAAAEELERIRQKYGALTPDMVVAESEAANAVLHPIFQWDDTLAAEAWRREQAASLIRNIVIVTTDEEVSIRVRALVNVATEASARRSYIPITEAILDRTAYDDLLTQAKNEMSAFVTKYSQISELNPVKCEMLKVLGQ